MYACIYVCTYVYVRVLFPATQNLVSVAPARRVDVSLCSSPYQG